MEQGNFNPSQAGFTTAIVQRWLKIVRLPYLIPGVQVQIFNATFGCPKGQSPGLLPGCRIPNPTQNLLPAFFGRQAGPDQPMFMVSRNSMLDRVFFSLFNSSSIASTGGTPVNARRNITTR